MKYIKEFSASFLFLLVALSLSGCVVGDSSPTALNTLGELSKDELYAIAIVDCLSDDGWNAEYDSRDGSVAFEGDASQSTAYDEAYEACAKPLRDDRLPISELSQEQWQSLYSQEQETAKCLRGLGVDIPQIAAFQTFVDRYQSEDPWRAYLYIGDPSESDYLNYLEQCPQPTI